MVFNLDSITPEAIQSYGVLNLKKSLDYCENELQTLMDVETPSNTKTYSLLAKSYYKLATHAKENELHHDFIEYTLCSMQYNSQEARQLFPSLLTIKNFQSHESTFITRTEQIPTWMFLKWIPQLLANPNLHATSKIILRISQTYPQAIMYAYRITRSKFQCQDSELLQQLDELLLKDATITNLLKSLSSVALPAKVLEYNLERLKDALDFDSVLSEVVADLFTESFVSTIRGDSWKYISDLHPYFEKLKRDKFVDLTKKCQEVPERFSKECDLSFYSPWLANYHFDGDIEIPGQYTGDMLPLTQYHAKIFSFAPYVSISKLLIFKFKRYFLKCRLK